MAWNVTLPKAEWYDQTSNIDALMNELKAQTHVAIDTETTGLVIWKDLPLFWSMSWGNRRVCLPADMLYRCRELFTDDRKNWVFANAKYDMHILANAGVQLKGKLVDTQVMHALIYEEQPHGLKEMANQILGWKWQDFFDTFKPQQVIDDESNEKRKERVGEMLMRTFHNDKNTLIEYASNDAFGTMQLYHKLKKELEDAYTYSLYPDRYATMWDLFWKTEVPFTRVLYKCERSGLLIDDAYLNSVGEPVRKELAKVEKDLFREVGWAINPNSPVQMRKLFFEELGLKALSKTKGGKSGIKHPQVNEEFLSYYAVRVDGADPKRAKAQQICEIMLEQRSLSKLLGTYVEGLPEHYDRKGRIHPRANQDVARTGRLSSSAPNCFHPATEVLTPSGWVPFVDYKKGGELAQWRPDGTIEFVTPTLYVKQRATELVHIRNQHIRLAVTEDHRCLLRHRKTGELRVFEAKNYPEDWQQLHAGTYRSGTKELPPDLLRLIIAIQADGHVLDGAVNFGLKKQRKIVRLLDVLTRLQVPYTYNPSDSRGRARIRLPNSPLTQQALSYLNGEHKAFDAWLLGLTEENLDLFCEEIFFWDGCWTRKNHYSCDNEQNAKWVQTVLALRGKRAHFREYVKANGGINYQVDVLHKDYSLTTNVEKQTLPYDGDVYCVSVPSSYLVVRYDGEIAITGQCQNIPNPEKDHFKIRGAFIAPQYYNLLCFDYQALEMRLLAAAAGEPDMIQIFLDGKDIHMGNASLVYGLPYEDIAKAKKKDKNELTEYDHQCIKARSDVKIVGFGLNYGMKEHLLAKNMKCTVPKALETMKKYMERYPAVSQFYQSSIEEARRSGYAFSVLGRRRFLPAIASTSQMDRWQAERQATNMEIQGSAADVVRMAMILIDEQGLDEQYGCHMLLQVHDELLFECPEETSDICMPIIEEIMEHSLPSELAVPLTVSKSRTKNWAEAK